MFHYSCTAVTCIVRAVSVWSMEYAYLCVSGGLADGRESPVRIPVRVAVACRQVQDLFTSLEGLALGGTAPEP